MTKSLILISLTSQNQYLTGQTQAHGAYFETLYFKLLKAIFNKKEHMLFIGRQFSAKSKMKNHKINSKDPKSWANKTGIYFGCLFLLSAKN